MDYDAVDKAIAEGKLWRAKEILEGRLAGLDFDRELLLRYGKVLLAMGDLVAAGRALFFAGYRDPEFRQPIELFLSRHPRAEPRRFLSGMPSMVRRQSHPADYLASDEFAVEGWSASALLSIRSRAAPKPRVRPSPAFGRLQNAVGMLVCIAFFSVFVAGLLTIGRLLVSLFR